MMYGTPLPRRPEITRTQILAIASLVVLAVAVIVGLWAGTKAMSRFQSRSDAANHATVARIHAQNQVTVSNIQIRNQVQRVKIAKQKAEIRLENAKGVREAQDRIAETLTDRYIQFEMVEAMKEIAKSGKNSSVIYVPAGQGGIPLIANADKIKDPETQTPAE